MHLLYLIICGGFGCKESQFYNEIMWVASKGGCQPYLCMLIFNYSSYIHLTFREIARELKILSKRLERDLI